MIERMKRMSIAAEFAVAALVMAAATACAGSKPMMDKHSVEAYHEALETISGHADAVDEGLALFRLAFGDLTHEDLAERIGELYADTFYFNDTVHIARSRDELIDYMARTGAGLSESHVEVHRVIRDGADVYLRWEMRFVSRAMGRRVESHSIGMTHLRFNERGQIVLHQDFWDSGNALYAHLPVVGFFVRRAQGAMQ